MPTLRACSGGNICCQKILNNYYKKGIFVKFVKYGIFSFVLLIDGQSRAEQTHSGKEIGGLSDVWTAADSSEANRQSLTLGVFAATGAQTIGGVNYAWNPDNQIEAGYRHDRYSGDSLNERKTDIKDLIVMYRRFLGWTFVVGGGLVHRTLKLNGQEWFGNEDVATSQFRHYSDYQRDREEIVAKVILGNQWQWRHFFVGMDWLTLEQFTMKQKDDFKSTPYLVPQSEAQRQILQLAEAHSVGANHGFNKSLKFIDPVFRLGWAF
mgnify:FL=1